MNRFINMTKKFSQEKKLVFGARRFQTKQFSLILSEGVGPRGIRPPGLAAQPKKSENPGNWVQFQ